MIITKQEIDKAKEIYSAMVNAGGGYISEHLAKQCALRCIDFMIMDAEIESDQQSYIRIKKEILKLSL